MLIVDILVMRTSISHEIISAMEYLVEDVRRYSVSLQKFLSFFLRATA